MYIYILDRFQVRRGDLSEKVRNRVWTAGSTLDGRDWISRLNSSRDFSSNNFSPAQIWTSISHSAHIQNSSCSAHMHCSYRSQSTFCHRSSVNLPPPVVRQFSITGRLFSLLCLVILLCSIFKSLVERF